MPRHPMQSTYMQHTSTHHALTRPRHGLWLAILGGALAMASLAACAGDAAPGFVNAPGFSEVDPQSLDGDAYYSADRFPEAGASAFNPDADLAAPVRALLLLESREGLLPHARYRVTYQLTVAPDNPDQTRSEVEIIRINLGPAVREDTMDGVPAEHQAPLEAFGVGPHVSWRFVMSPLQGMTAGLDAASRRELSAAEVAGLDCLGTPCGQLESPTGPDGAWREQEWPESGAAYRAVGIDGPHPAFVVDQLLAVMGEDALQPTAVGDGAPRFHFVVSANAGGQDVMTTGLGRNSVVMDDEIGTVWVRSHQHSDGPGEISELMVARAR